MSRLSILKSALIGGTSAAVLTSTAVAHDFNIPPGDLGTALSAYIAQTGDELIVAANGIRQAHTKGVKGELTADVALSRILAGTGFVEQRDGGAVAIVPQETKPARSPAQLKVAATAPQQQGIETVVVTAQHKSENIQQVPIAITALSQQELTARQIAGGPDLVKEVPNLTFSKTNFSGYNLEIRGIGTQAISVTTDPAVAVAFNSIPFIRNHFFEQEFYDLQDAEVLRGPQGTLYGRNATAGVVNIESAKPIDQFEAMASTDIGNYGNRRLEGMINLPVAGDQLDIRMAAEWTKRDGYTDDTTLGTQVDGRDLWSSRLTIGWKPASDVQTYFIWEHFSEDDDRLRSGKQLCKTDPGPTSFTAANGTVVPAPPAQGSAFGLTNANFSQGCEDTSLYSPQAFEVPNGFSLPFVSGAAFLGFLNTNINPYAETTQSTNLRDIQSAILPRYIAKNDTLEYNADWNMGSGLTFTSQTGYNNDFLWSSEDYNRFDTSPGVFIPGAGGVGQMDVNPIVPQSGIFCDPQLGCSNRLVLQDLSTERAWQFSQEFRLASNYAGPLNFSVGANYLHYETVEDYYVFSNTFTMISLSNGCRALGGITNGAYASIEDSLQCLPSGKQYLPPQNGGGVPTEAAQYIDPNPLSGVNGEGHNYFLSENPYVLNSYAAFGESYFNVTNELKLTAGLRFTDDEKQFIDIPSQLLTIGYGYPSIGSVDQQWDQFTGRFVANWTPDLDFTDHSMIYASFAHGYKAGGANPPGPVLINADVSAQNGVSINDNFPDHPLTFKPEFIEAFELGTKNTALDNSLTVNADIFYYNYSGYQISEIVDRTAINLNFNANVEGAELESNWEPLPGLRFSFAGGFETSSLAGGSEAIDLMDRTAGMPGWTIMKPSVGQSSNCIFPTYVAAALLQEYPGIGEVNVGNPGNAACGAAYYGYLDPVTLLPYVPYPTVAQSGAVISPIIATGYPGFNPATAPNEGEGFDKNLGGNQLPNAPHFTTSLTAEYSMPVSDDWVATLHGDFYWQSQQWARVFEDPIDKIHGYSNVNLSLVLTNDAGWQVMGYVKNVFNVTAITGTFLNSDDSGLTTNVFLTDPRLYGVRITKQMDDGDWPSGGISFIPDLFSDTDGGKPPLWIELGGDFAMLNQARNPYAPSFTSLVLAAPLPSPLSAEKAPAPSFDWEAKASFDVPDSDWILSAAVHYGRSSSNVHLHRSVVPLERTSISVFGSKLPCSALGAYATACRQAPVRRFEDILSAESEQHTVLDFLVGKDVGLGSLSSSGSSIISGGVRVAQFTSRGSFDANSDPDYTVVHSGTQKYHDVFDGIENEKRSFHGIGPEIMWDASSPVTPNVAQMQWQLNWGLNGAMLIGRQSAAGSSVISKCHDSEVRASADFGSCLPVPTYPHRISFKRSRIVAVPNLGAYAGVSMQWNNAKVSFGYRADEFFGAMDGGQDTYRSVNRGFFGPYAKLSLGLGG